MNTHHTPGPWSCEQAYPPRVTVHIEVYGKPFVLAECFSMEASGEREANARLIAAAPDLLEALQCLLPGLILDLRYADDDDDKDALRSRIETVEAAISKATLST